MLTITQSQLDALNRIAEQNFIKEVAVDLQKNSVGVASDLSHNEIIKRVGATINCAKSFGLSSQYSLTMFTEISFITGPRFYKHFPINHMLQNKSIKPNHRIKMILKEVDGDCWESIQGIDDWQSYCQEFTANV